VNSYQLGMFKLVMRALFLLLAFIVPGKNDIALGVLITDYAEFCSKAELGNE